MTKAGGVPLLLGRSWSCTQGVYSLYAVSILFLGVLTSLFKWDHVVGRTFEFSSSADWLLWEVGAEKELVMPQIYSTHRRATCEGKGDGLWLGRGSRQTTRQLNKCILAWQSSRAELPTGMPTRAPTTGLVNCHPAQALSGDCSKGRVAPKAELCSADGWRLAADPHSSQLNSMPCFSRGIRMVCTCVWHNSYFGCFLFFFWFVFSWLLYSNTNARMQWIYEKVW